MDICSGEHSINSINVFVYEMADETSSHFDFGLSRFLNIHNAREIDHRVRNFEKGGKYVIFQIRKTF